MSRLTGTAEGSIERTIRLVKMTEIRSRVSIDALGIAVQTEKNHRFVNQLSDEFRYELRVSNKDLRKGIDRLSESYWTESTDLGLKFFVTTTGRLSHVECVLVQCLENKMLHRSRQHHEKNFKNCSFSST